MTSAAERKTNAPPPPKYSAMLVVLLVLLVASPILPSWGLLHWQELVFDVVLITGAHSAAWDTKHRWPFTGLTVLTLAIRWTDLVSSASILAPGAIALTVVWIGYALALISIGLFTMKKVTTNSIFGAVVVYLLAAVAFALIFELVEFIEPGSFSGLTLDRSGKGLADSFLYFSLVCLTTIGFGDILPVTDLARRLTVAESAFGTLYLGVMIARLVGIHASEKNDSD